MPILKSLKQFLDLHDAEYSHSVHEPAFSAKQLARIDHVPAGRVAKTTVLRADDSSVMAVLPADEWVILTVLASAIGASRIRLATEAELIQLFPDCEVGAMPPFGNLFGLPAYIDGALAAQKRIEFLAGTHRDVIYMKFSEFIRLTNPTVLHFGVKAAA
jgi:Ala-tRNA(Pro) deacylase